MAIIDCVDWQPQSNDIFAWKYPKKNLTTATQLIVRENQEAVFFSKGQILGKFGPGKHILSTENMPILHNLFGIPFGKKNPFTAEVWFVNKATSLTIDWETTPVKIIDADYGEMIPIVAKGRYGVKIRDAEKFLVKLVGTLEVFNSKQLTDHFLGPLIAKTNSSIVSFMTSNQVGIVKIASCLDQLSTHISDTLNEFWDEYGVDLKGFYITSVDLDTSTPEGQKIANAISDRSAQNIAGYTWQQMQSFGVVNNAVQNSHDGIGVIGAAMMMGSGFNGNSEMASAMMTPKGYDGFSQQFKNPSINQRGTVYCSRCGKSFSSNNRFCPHCGDPNNPCPVCGRDNDENAKRCTVCGASLVKQNNTIQGNACSRCGKIVPIGAKFCPACGNRM